MPYTNPETIALHSLLHGKNLVCVGSIRRTGINQSAVGSVCHGLCLLLSGGCVHIAKPSMHISAHLILRSTTRSHAFCISHAPCPSKGTENLLAGHTVSTNETGCLLRDSRNAHAVHDHALDVKVLHVVSHATAG